VQWRRAFDYWLAGYRRVWRASIVSGFLAPLLYLGSFGLGLGTLVGDRLSGLSYLAFVAPGILAAGAMQTAIGEATYPVLTSMKWNRQYHAQLATPLTTTDLFLGHLAFVAFRVALGAVAFLVVGAALGAFGSPLVVLAVPVAVICGLAHAAPTMAFAVRQETDGSFFLVYRFVMTPLFLFAGTFFPVSQLPYWLERLAWVTPLWHATALSRDLSAGTTTAWLALGHLAYLGAWVLVGVLVGARSYRAVLLR
jgi:lipooligosaccharide transport system permease protein